MAGSLQDQFLKAGLVTEKQAKKARHESRKSKKKSKGKVQAPTPPGPSAVQVDKAAEDRARNQAIESERRAKALAAEVRQLIDRHALTIEEPDTTFNVQDAGVVRTVHLTEPLRAQLLRGEIAIVASGETLHLVDAPTAARIEARDPASIKAWLREEDSKADPDDPYAEYAVPDDLVW